MKWEKVESTFDGDVILTDILIDGAIRDSHTNKKFKEFHCLASKYTDFRYVRRNSFAVSKQTNFSEVYYENIQQSSYTTTRLLIDITKVLIDISSCSLKPKNRIISSFAHFEQL